MTIIDSILGRNTEPEDSNQELTKGKVLKLSKDGYGFLCSDSMPFTRIFFHWSVLTMDSPNFTKLKPNMPAEFKAIEIEGKGWRAIMVKVHDNTEKDS